MSTFLPSKRVKGRSVENRGGQNGALPRRDRSRRIGRGGALDRRASGGGEWKPARYSVSDGGRHALHRPHQAEAEPAHLLSNAGKFTQSVAFGLALIGLEENLEPWLARSMAGQEHCDLGDDPG